MLSGAEQVVIERFIGESRLNAVRTETIELVGGVRAWCHINGVKLDLPTPGMRYSHMNVAREACGPGKLIERSKWSKHEIDALAHLLAWEYRNA